MHRSRQEYPERRLTPIVARRLLRRTPWLLLVATPAWAHPGPAGHFGLGAGFAHPFLGLDHLLAMVAVGLWAAQLGGRAVWALPFAFVSALLAGACLGIAGVGLPAHEPLIAASVLTLGLLVALRVRMTTAAAALPVALFALAHGFAHGAELPANASATGYVLGFTLATATLHAGGVTTGLWLRARAAALRAAGVPIAATGCVLCGLALVRALP